MEALAALATVLLMLLGIHCHRRWHAIFPEDPPALTGRRRHPVPTPMAGFVPAVVALFGVATVMLSAWLLTGVAIATVVGYCDDRGKAEDHEMAWHTKAVLLLLATGLVTAHFAQSIELGVLGILLVAGFVFAVTNAVNFMDNTDGVAAAVGGSALLFASDASGALAITGFAFLGFLPANWPRARAFLGDSGSLPLGLCVAVGAITYAAAAEGEPSATSLAFWLAAAVPPAVFLADFVQVITARLILGVPPWVGDRRHLSHIAQNLGVPRVLVAPLFAGIGWTVYALV